ncbi:MAG: sulfite exporter TauE/SafE family protein [Candidatus Zixiibacteriota bacterium]|nr:MAG: sulfite exporter TauE/SafE family protein [candidate division Zixibacteria bacterium]
MFEQLLYILCGLSAGLLGGYLGLGGGIIMVPFLTVVAGVDIKIAVPISITAIVVNSFSASNEYLKKGMVDLELVIILSVFMVLGNITGSFLSSYIPSTYVSLILTVILLYAAFSLLKGRKPVERMTFKDNRTRYLLVCTVLSYLTGAVGALVGIGGCVIIIPVLYLIIGLPLSTARGTCSLMLGFSAAAASTVYFLNGQIDVSILPGVVLGIILGAKFGGYLGTMAKPLVVKILFFIIMLYLAYRLSYQPIQELL